MTTYREYARKNSDNGIEKKEVKMEQFAKFTSSPDGLVAEFEDRAVLVGNCYSHQLWQMVVFNSDGSIGTVYPPQDDEDEAAVKKAQQAVVKLKERVKETLSESEIGQHYRCAKILGVPTGCWV